MKGWMSWVGLVWLWGVGAVGQEGMVAVLTEVRGQ